jgi:cytochrome c
MARLAFLSSIAVALVVGAIAVASSTTPSAQSGPRVLVFSKTTGFRHESIPAGIAAVRELGLRSGFAVDATENSASFTRANLARYDAVVFLMTTGDVLNNQQQRAFERYFRAGGGYVGVHSAADTEYGWSWYGRLLGTFFRSHPHIQSAAIDVADRRHPATVALPRRWTRTDEWYNFTRRPTGVRVLATLDESSYQPGSGAMGTPHPIVWAHEFQGGRAWFTGGGHTAESYSEPLFRSHLLGGIRYAAGLSPPQVVAVSFRVQRGRVVVSLRYRSCVPCSGVLRVRKARVRIRLANRSGSVVSPRLPRGLWPFTIELKDPQTGLRHVVRRSARIR